MSTCPSCHRHVHVDADSCPFCKTRIETVAADQARVCTEAEPPAIVTSIGVTLGATLTTAAAFTVSALLMTGCAKENEEPEDQVSVETEDFGGGADYGGPEDIDWGEEESESSTEAGQTESTESTDETGSTEETESTDETCDESDSGTETADETGDCDMGNETGSDTGSDTGTETGSDTDTTG